METDDQSFDNTGIRQSMPNIRHRTLEFTIGIKKGKRPEQYKTKKEMSGLLEKQSVAGNIALYDADETRISETGYVPYGWQFADEDCYIEVQRGKSMNCFGLLSRANEFIYKNTAQHIHADFIVSELDDFSLKIKKATVVVLDNASAHQSKKVVRLIRHLETKRVAYLLFAPLLSAAQYYGKVMERNKRGLDKARR